MVRLLLALLAVFSAANLAHAGEMPPGVKLWIEVDHPERPIHPQQMVVLRVKGRFTAYVTLEKMENPVPKDYRIQRIGNDRWTEVFENGISQKAFERIVTIFPEFSGKLTVGPFIHHLTIADANNKHVKTDVTVDPITLDVSPPLGVKGEWWLPASRLTVTEKWSIPPDAIGVGQTARRTLTFEAYGIFDDQIPPPPSMQIGEMKMIVFAGPTSRATKLGMGEVQKQSELALREQSLRKPGRLEEVKNVPLGPFAVVSYSWDFRPATDMPMTLPALSFPWFDTESGMMKIAKIAPRTVGYKAWRNDEERLTAELGISGDAGISADQVKTEIPLIWPTLLGTLAFAGTLALMRKPTRKSL